MKNNVYDFYKRFYDLETIKLNVSDKKILFLIYDEYNYYYLKNNKFIDSNKNISILSLVEEFNDKYKLEITNFYPVCFSNETLVIALKTNSIQSSKLEVVDYNKLNKKYSVLIDYHMNLDETLFLSNNVIKEISMSQKYIKRYMFHENFIKKYILTHKKRKKDEYKKLLENLIPERKSIIDVSCGDNPDTFTIAKNKHYDVIVGNDICINYLNTQIYKDIYYTNEDVVLNKFKKKSFDVSYCKNTLHHMDSISGIKRILNFLDTISDEIIIVEIENPREKNGLPKLLNKYLYTKFLKDMGKCYINRDIFKKLIDEKFSNCDKKYDYFTNILGTYMICKITRKKA